MSSADTSRLISCSAASVSNERGTSFPGNAKYIFAPFFTGRKFDHTHERAHERQVYVDSDITQFIIHTNNNSFLGAEALPCVSGMFFVRCNVSCASVRVARAIVLI